ncbi:MAG: HIT family protein [Treponemataceae bacterium]
MDYFFNFEKLTYLTGERPSGCILCHIRDGDSSVIDLTVYRKNGFMVCLNLYPYNPGHVIIFPERHVLDIRGFNSSERAELDRTIDLTLNVLDAAMKPAGYNIGCNMGLVAGASIEHIHWHVIPRYPREIGIAELLAGKRVLVDHPLDTQARLKEAFDQSERKN